MNIHCFYCKRETVSGESVNSLLMLTRDHIVPLSKGGRKKGVNIIDCCYECNKLKADRLLPEFIDFLKERIANKRTHLPQKIYHQIIESCEILSKKVIASPSHYNTIQVSNDDLPKIPKLPVKKVDENSIDISTPELRRGLFIRMNIHNTHIDVIEKLKKEPEPNFHYSD